MLTDASPRKPPANRADGASIVLSADERERLFLEARAHVGDILAHALMHDATHAALVVADERCELTRLLSLAYRAALPGADYISFDDAAPEAIIAAFDRLQRGDLVVLVQSLSFRLSVFRIRLELYNRGLKVIEHPHLAGMGKDEIPFYVAALAYDPAYYRTVGPALKLRLDRAQRAEVHSGADQPLVYDSPFESAKLNIGDYAGMVNVGGQFPIGEVFTEAKNLERVSGQVRLSAFGDASFRVNAPARLPTLLVDHGRVHAAVDATPELDEILEVIRAEEGEVWIRELGFGMNRAFTRERRVSDIGSYERMCGVHLSLGAKHNIYQKPQFKRKEAKYHVDVFVATARVTLDDEEIFRDGGWCV